MKGRRVYDIVMISISAHLNDEERVTTSEALHKRKIVDAFPFESAL